MSEDRTAETDGGRSFEERVFLRFDALDGRLNGFDSRFEGVEKRLEKLEARQYDTKPIWELALSEIAEMRANMQTRGEAESGISALRTETQAGFQEVRTEIQEARAEMQNDFQEVRTELDDGLRKTADQIDALNRTILEVRGEIRYFNRRIQKLESEMVKPS